MAKSHHADPNERLFEPRLLPGDAIGKSLTVGTGLRHRYQECNLPARRAPLLGIATSDRSLLPDGSLAALHHGHTRLKCGHPLWHLAEITPQRDIAQRFRTSSITSIALC
jgi:hypothetical protein